MVLLRPNSCCYVKNDERSVFHLCHWKYEPWKHIAEGFILSMTTIIWLGIVASVFLNKIFTSPNCASQLFFVWLGMRKFIFDILSFHKLKSMRGARIFICFLLAPEVTCCQIHDSISTSSIYFLQYPYVVQHRRDDIGPFTTLPVVLWKEKYIRVIRLARVNSIYLEFQIFGEI